MAREEIWTNVVLESLGSGSVLEVIELADQVLEAYDKRFGSKVKPEAPLTPDQREAGPGARLRAAGFDTYIGRGKARHPSGVRINYEGGLWRVLTPDTTGCGFAFSDIDKAVDRAIELRYSVSQ